MFDDLSKKLDSVLGKFRQRGLLTEPMVRDGLREVRRVLLEADVNYQVTRDFPASLSSRLFTTSWSLFSVGKPPLR